MPRDLTDVKAYLMEGLTPEQIEQMKTAPAEKGYRYAARRLASYYGLDPDKFEAQVDVESAFNPKAQSNKGAQGIAQFIPETAQRYGVDVRDPLSSLNGMARHMRDLTQEFAGDWEKAATAYHSGADNVKNDTLGKYGKAYAPSIAAKREELIARRTPAPTPEPTAGVAIASMGGGQPPAQPEAAPEAPPAEPTDNLLAQAGSSVAEAGTSAIDLVSSLEPMAASQRLLSAAQDVARGVPVTEALGTHLFNRGASEAAAPYMAPPPVTTTGTILREGTGPIVAGALTGGLSGAVSGATGALGAYAGEQYGDVVGLSPGAGRAVGGLLGGAVPGVVQGFVHAPAAVGQVRQEATDAAKAAAKAETQARLAEWNAPVVEAQQQSAANLARATQEVERGVAITRMGTGIETAAVQALAQQADEAVAATVQSADDFLATVAPKLDPQARATAIRQVLQGQDDAVRELQNAQYTGLLNGAHERGAMVPWAPVGISEEAIARWTTTPGLPTSIATRAKATMQTALERPLTPMEAHFLQSDLGKIAYKIRRTDPVAYAQVRALQEDVLGELRNGLAEVGQKTAKAYDDLTAATRQDFKVFGNRVVRKMLASGDEKAAATAQQTLNTILGPSQADNLDTFLQALYYRKAGPEAVAAHREMGAALLSRFVQQATSETGLNYGKLRTILRNPDNDLVVRKLLTPDTRAFLLRSLDDVVQSQAQAEAVAKRAKLIARRGASTVKIAEGRGKDAIAGVRAAGQDTILARQLARDAKPEPVAVSVAPHVPSVFESLLQPGTMATAAAVASGVSQGTPTGMVVGGLTYGGVRLLRWLVNGENRTLLRRAMKTPVLSRDGQALAKALSVALATSAQTKPVPGLPSAVSETVEAPSATASPRALAP